jgi:hypothetical protein
MGMYSKIDREREREKLAGLTHLYVCCGCDPIFDLSENILSYFDVRYIMLSLK